MSYLSFIAKFYATAIQNEFQNANGEKVKNKAKSILFLFSLNLSLLLGMQTYAQEFLDVESLPCYRTARYKTGTYKNIVIFSAPRTGSTLVYNVFKYLFEKNEQISGYHNYFDLNRVVLKTHRFEMIELTDPLTTLYVIPTRNILDSCISNYRVVPRTILDVRMLAQQLVSFYRKYPLYYEMMESKGRKILWLKYDHFIENIDVLFQYIETEFALLIAHADKKLLKQGLCRENIEHCTDCLASFAEYLPLSGFHGNHLGQEGYLRLQEFVAWAKCYIEMD